MTDANEQRKYTVSEIDALRHVLTDRYLWGTSATSFIGNGGGAASRSYSESDLTKVVEEQIRTYMMAGITADDIRNEDLERARKIENARKERANKQRDPHGLRKLMRVD